jgi:hypothetical protein
MLILFLVVIPSLGVHSVQPLPASSPVWVWVCAALLRGTGGMCELLAKTKYTAWMACTEYVIQNAMHEPPTCRHALLRPAHT